MSFKAPQSERTPARAGLRATVSVALADGGLCYHRRSRNRARATARVAAAVVGDELARQLGRRLNRGAVAGRDIEELLVEQHGKRDGDRISADVKNAITSDL